ncbi:MAG TPA: 3-phosphoserine/phosphohydroxythreonine transaminase [Candidatus Tetragenococcus pullicola]|nr:3-phosphoserine/phosphohydroxythreonine transaminase [Candidatus Tetragenococcus pullicola]
MPLYNFSAGPAVVPHTVLKKAQKEFLNFQGSQLSVVELSHRAKGFEEIIQEAEALLRELMDISEEYAVLFLQGGASLQFSMLPLNLAQKNKALYVNSGTWARKAIAAAQTIDSVTVEVIASSEKDDFHFVPKINSELVDQKAAYLHITTNETIDGIFYRKIPKVGKVPIVADMSSNILANDYSTEDFGVIYAGAQKNMGIAGLTLVIIRKDLLNQEVIFAPMLDYSLQAKNNSMYNTPPVFAIYMAKLVLEWVKEKGGVSQMYHNAQKKSALLYEFLDHSQIFSSPVEKSDRSLTTIPFVTGNPDLDQQFIEQAKKEGLENLKGHRSVGGMRASIYNAMPTEGVTTLVNFMKKFEGENGGK